MATQRWTSAEMMRMSGTLVEPGHIDRQVMENVPELAALLPRLRAAHDRLIESYQDTPAFRLAPLVQALGRADWRHDSLVRALYFAFESLIQTAQGSADQTEAERLRQLRHRLLPQGLQLVKFSYRDEASHAEFMSAQLDAQTRQNLAGLTMHGRSLLDMSQDLMGAARTLGQLEDERQMTRQAPSADLSPARDEWLATFHVVECLLRLNRAADPHVDAILARIAAIDAVAEERAEFTSRAPAQPVEKANNIAESAA